MRSDPFAVHVAGKRGALHAAAGHVGIPFWARPVLTHATRQISLQLRARDLSGERLIVILKGCAIEDVLPVTIPIASFLQLTSNLFFGPPLL